MTPRQVIAPQRNPKKKPMVHLSDREDCKPICGARGQGYEPTPNQPGRRMCQLCFTLT